MKITRRLLADLLCAAPLSAAVQAEAQAPSDWPSKPVNHSFINAPSQQVFEVPADTAQNHHIEGLPFGTRGGILIRHQFPVDGQ